MHDYLYHHLSAAHGHPQHAFVRVGHIIHPAERVVELEIENDICVCLARHLITACGTFRG